MNMSFLLTELDNPSSIERRRARVALIELGDEAIPALTNALSNPHHLMKQEALKALEAIGDDAAAQVLVKALDDDDFGIRWIAAEALASMGHTGLKALLRALVHDSGMSWLREGAHHVLHFYKGELNKPLEQLLNALDDNDIGASVTWDAGVALQSIESTRTHEASGATLPIDQ